jgi:RNA polymerase sigma factor (sigma-70 family)
VRAPVTTVSSPLQTAIFSSATLAEFYRFALLLTGRSAAAEQVIAETLAAVEAQLEQIRTETNRQAWLVAHIRQRCLQNNEEDPAPNVPRLLREPLEPGERTEVLAIEAYILAEHFRCLPEPQRSALALFYLDLFTPEEIAQLLKMNLEELGAVLAQARQHLQWSLDGGVPQVL